MSTVTPGAAAAGAAFCPRLRLSTEPAMVGAGTTGFREMTLPVLALSFDYGGVSIPSSDKRPRFFTAGAAGPSPVDRDLDGERAARYLLESFGAVELACLEDHSATPGSQADYIVR